MSLLSSGTAEACFAAAVRGSSQALGELLEAFRKPLEDAASGQLGTSLNGKVGISDLVQESLAAAAIGFPQFRGKTVGEFRAWIAQILENRAVDLARRFRSRSRDVAREHRNGHMMLNGLDDARLTASQQVVHEESLKQLVRVMENLSQEERQLVHWRYQEGLSFDQIAKCLNLPRETARRRWYEVIDRIGRELAED